MTDLKRVVHFEPGHNCLEFMCKWGKDGCKPNSGQSHGIHGLEIGMYLKGPKGTIQFKFAILDLVPGREEMNGFTYQSTGMRGSGGVMAMDLGYHSPVPQYEDQKPLSHDCPWVEGGECHYDGSSTAAAEVLKMLVEHGEDVVWEYLEGVYHAHLENAPWPDKPETKLVPRRGGAT